MNIYTSQANSTFAKVSGYRETKITGPGSSAIKYDVLTALLVTVAQDSGSLGRLAGRLSLVITARFNWRLGVFTVGLTELARMWGVTERTAKREMAQMRSLGWISVERPAARGRVAQHRIEFTALLRSTAPHWDAVGPDFAARMTGAPEPTDTPNVVPLHGDSVSLPAEDGSNWPRVAEILSQSDPATYRSWFANLIPVDCDAEVWVLMAPSRFAASYIQTHLKDRVLMAIATIDRSVRRVEVIADGV